MNHLVVTFIGPDRAGVVDTLSNIVKKHHGNWQTSSMHHLSGFFAGVFEVAVEAANSDELSIALQSIDGFKVNVEKTANIEQQSANVTMEFTASDRAGIVQEISSVIHHHGGNLIKLVSKRDNAPYSGQMMFKAKAQVSVKDDDIDTLISALENIGDDLMVDISQ